MNLDGEIPKETLNFGIYTDEDMEFSDILARIILARQRLVKETGKDCIKNMACCAKELEQFVAKKIDQHNNIPRITNLEG